MLRARLLHLEADVPHALVAVTHKLPLLKLFANKTVTVLVPCPAVIDELDGVVQVYDVAPETEGTENV